MVVFDRQIPENLVKILRYWRRQLISTKSFVILKNSSDANIFDSLFGFGSEALDEVDELLGDIYGLNEEKVEFIQEYDKEIRMSD